VKTAVVVLAAAVLLAVASPAAAFDHFNSFNLSGNASAGAQPGAALDASNSLAATMGTTLDVHAAATATISIPGFPYVAKAQPVSKGIGTVTVRFSVLCGPKAAGTIAVHQVVARMYDSANQEIPSASSPENVSLTFTCPAVATAPPQRSRPDLVLTSFGFESSANCAYTFSVGVKNQGGSTWSGVEPAVVVKDMHAGVLDAWGTGLGIDPPLAPGETRLVKVTVQPYSANPAHMTANAPHPFRATVNDNHVVDESNFGNDAAPGPATWNGMKVIMMGAPNGCGTPKAGITARAGAVAGANGALAPAPTKVPTVQPPR
jgi:hypothetical protein